MGRGKRELAKEITYKVSVLGERKKSLGKGRMMLFIILPRIEKGRCARRS